MADLFADENFSLLVVRELRRLGDDVLTTREAGLANRRISDPDILQVAIAAGRAILTHNRRDYVRLHLRRADHAGIIICTEDGDFERLARRIHDAISLHASLAGLLIRVTRPGPAEDSV